MVGIVPNNKYCLLTNDVELTSIVNNSLRIETGMKVSEEGLPKLLELYKKYNIKSTFFITGKFAESFPNSLKQIIEDGHEIGSHGYRHEVDQAFDILSLDEQIEHLSLSKKLLLENGAEHVRSFRAPALRVNNDTVKALKQNGFVVDSSTASQRFDFFLSFGGLKKLKWLSQPRKPYFITQDSFYKKGSEQILEVPVSAFLLSYIGTTLRVFPTLTKALGLFLRTEAKLTGKPIVFLIHPVEVITEKQEGKLERRTRNLIKYLLADKLRRFLKLRNLGDNALNLYEQEIIKMKKAGFKFVTMSEYLEIFKVNK